MTKLVLPRPGHPHPTLPPIPGPSEISFTRTFGPLLPPAQYLHTAHGKAAFYVFPPSTSEPSRSPTTSTSTPPPPPSDGPKRVLLIHGVQTPALGLFPLTTALRAQFPHATFATLDLWGHGLSDTPAVPHEGALFQALIEGVLEELGWGEGVHVVGFSFGSVLTMGVLAGSAGRGRVGSYVLVAPAGLVRERWWEEEQRGWLGRACGEGDEARAAEWVVRVLEGGELVVPRDWRERVGRGEVVAEALREWQMQHHEGHEASVVAVFRDGGVIDNDQLFVEARKTGLPSLVILGEKDDLSTEKEVLDFGFDVRVVPGAGHGVVRENAGEVAGHIADFWRRLS